MSVTNLFNGDDPTIANRYLAGQLTEAERATFEAQLESNSVTLQELEATARLKVGLERLRETGQLDDMLRPTFTVRQVLVGLAATVTIGVIALSFMLGYFRQPTSTPLLAAAASTFADKQGSAPALAGTYALFTKRVSDYDATVELPPERKVLAFRVLPQSLAPLKHYRVSMARTLDDGALEPAQSISDLIPAEDGFVTVFVDSALLVPGRYRMTVSADGEPPGPTNEESFLIRVHRSSNN